MRRFISAAALIAALALGSSPALAGSPQDFEAWLAAAIDRNMTFPIALERSNESGIATIRFSVAADGRPANVRIVESSGSRIIDRAAMRAVATLELPAGAPAGPHFAVLQYGTEASIADASEHAARMDAAVGQARLALRELAGGREALAAGAAAAPDASTID